MAKDNKPTAPEVPEGTPLSDKKIEKLNAEAKKVDDETATRTSRYDQDVKERARTYGINPDNFETEEALGAAVKKHEDDNGILGTPEERDQ